MTVYGHERYLNLKLKLKNSFEKNYETNLSERKILNKTKTKIDHYATLNHNLFHDSCFNNGMVLRICSYDIETTVIVIS